MTIRGPQWASMASKFKHDNKEQFVHCLQQCVTICIWDSGAGNPGPAVQDRAWYARHALSRALSHRHRCWCCRYGLVCNKHSLNLPGCFLLVNWPVFWLYSVQSSDCAVLTTPPTPPPLLFWPPVTQCWRAKIMSLIDLGSIFVQFPFLMANALMPFVLSNVMCP